MESVSLVFPHQLFEEHPALVPGNAVVLVEEHLYFNQYPFHKQKIVLHRATMRMYKQRLERLGYSVEYIEAINPLNDIRQLLKHLADIGTKTIRYCKTADDWLESRLHKAAGACGIQLIAFESPNFICTEDYLNGYFGTKKRYYLTAFYTDQRLRLNLMVKDGKPEGGKWTYDTENRLKMPAGQYVPRLPELKQNDFVAEAITYTEQHFAKNYGRAQPFNYPVTYAESRTWLDAFFADRFAYYGVYQDAIVPDERYLFHAVITPMLNIGLLSPTEVVEKAIEAGKVYNVPLNSVEGFVRQVLGWREYIRAVYMREGRKERTRNYWNHERTIPAAFYDGTTGIKPVDDSIKKLLKTGYNHHIERLMILGNFMCLCGFHPDAIYQWFMELYIDAYDWVMVPNVYGMSQYADGGLMSTKPYISSSNYILKMSHYKAPGNERWMRIWDALYWRFIYNNKAFFSKNPRMAVMVKQLDKMGGKLQEHLQIAEDYLATLSPAK